MGKLGTRKREILRRRGSQVGTAKNEKGGPFSLTREVLLRRRVMRTTIPLIFLIGKGRGTNTGMTHLGKPFGEEEIKGWWYNW